MKHGFIKVATATPKITVADCRANLCEVLRLWSKATDKGVKLLVYPQLSLTGHSCADLFFSETLLKSAEDALHEFLRKTKDSDTISIIGLPLIVKNKLYNSAAICQKGTILGIVPKATLPASELRYFKAAPTEIDRVCICGQTAPFGTEQIFSCTTLPSFCFGVELGEDLMAARPSSSYLAEAGAVLIANPAFSPEIVAQADFRRLMVTSQSARILGAYLYADCGEGESTTDTVCAGHALIAENGKLLAERLPFASDDGLTVSEIDCDRLARERRLHSTCFCSTDRQAIAFDWEPEETTLTRSVDAHPFIPSCREARIARCETILTIQAKGLAQRLERAYAKTCVIGISGGLDSCLAILVAARAMDLLGRPHDQIIGVTMPCFGTTQRTKSNAEILCRELGTQLRCVNIADSVRQHFAEIGHEESDRSVVYENAQARERTQVIMDIANMENGLVVGTGDLSELALGWATYNGDHMSMYGVNGDVPKTLIRHIVAYCADVEEQNGKSTLAAALRDILDTPVSPELLPADHEGNIAQKTEDLVGPYEIHDFYLYYMIRCGFAPDKLFRLAKLAFAGVYSDEILLKWLKNFVRRFFAQQFKRSCLPDGPKVGSVGFSPRGDWSMPSDASAREWLRIADSL